jgi:hypothetical protein
MFLHVPGVDNGPAAALSRLQVDKFRSLCPTADSVASGHYTSAGLHQLDVMAGKLLVAAVSDRTREAYHRAWRHLQHFHSVYGVNF